MSKADEKLCGVIRVDPDLERYIIERAKATRLTKVGVIRTWADEARAREQANGKRVVAVQGSDGTLRTDPSFR